MDTENILGSEEVWRDIAGFEGLYQISSWGNVKSLPKRGRNERILKPFLSCEGGYLKVDLLKNNIKHKRYVHALVAEAFIPNSSNLPCINHLDEDKTNNRVENLEWVTYLQNNTYGTRLEKISQKLMGNTSSQKGGAERKRAVMQFSADGKYIATFDGVRVAARAVTSTSGGVSHINQCCHRKCPTAYGFVWRFVDDNGGGTKPVAQVDENGQILRRFPSTRHAAEVYNISSSGIAKCCNGHSKTFHGMRFTYLERGSF